MHINSHMQLYLPMSITAASQVTKSWSCFGEAWVLHWQKSRQNQYQVGALEDCITHPLFWKKLWFHDSLKIDVFFNYALEQTGTNFRQFCSLGRHHCVFAIDLLREAREYTPKPQCSSLVYAFKDLKLQLEAVNAKIMSLALFCFVYKLNKLNFQCWVHLHWGSCLDDAVS